MNTDKHTVVWTGYALARATVTSKHMSELQTYTLSSGKTIELKRVSIFTLQLATKNIKAPKPVIDAVTGEENTAHPDFLNALVAHQQAETDARVDAIYACGIVTPEGDGWKNEVAEFRAFAESMGWDEPPPNDWLVYIKYVLLTTLEDFQNVQSLIMSGSLPTEETIGIVAETFKSEVEGRADSVGVDATVGGDSRES